MEDEIKYKEAINKIKETDAIRLRLLGFVPLVSGGNGFALSLGILNVPTKVIYLASAIGALISFFLYRWERLNIHYCYASSK